MRQLLDEMHAGRAAAELRSMGFDVQAVQERADLRGAADQDVLAAAAGESRALVTENVRDLAAIARQWAAEGRAHAGIVFTSPKRFNRARLAYPGDLVPALSTFVTQDPLDGTSDWIWWL